MGVTTQHIVQGYNSELHIPGSILTEVMAESSVELVALISLQVTGATALTLRGIPVLRTTLQGFHRHWNGAATEPT